MPKIIVSPEHKPVVSHGKISYTQQTHNSYPRYTVRIVKGFQLFLSDNILDNIFYYDRRKGTYLTVFVAQRHTE